MPALYGSAVMTMAQAGFAAVLSSMLWSAASLSQSVAEPRVAIQGYDPVAYFTEGRPTKGLPEIHQDFDGLRYYFANEQHKSSFAADPERYVPQFGANCAAALSIGKVAPADPLLWKIVDGKLFLFGSPRAVAAHEKRPGILVRSRQNWESLKNK